MAITSGVGPHKAFINGIPITSGSVTQKANRSSSTFSVSVPMFAPGASALQSATEGEITATAHGITGQLIKCHIDKKNFDFIGTMIHVIGRDPSAKLHGGKSAEKWQNKKGSDITKELVGRAGLGSGQIQGSKLDAGKKVGQETVKLTDGISLATVIHHVSQFDGARWWVDPQGKFHYQSNVSGGGSSYSLNWQAPSSGRPMVSDCLGLQVIVNVPAQNVGVTVKSWNPSDKKNYTGQAQEGGGSGDKSEYNYHIPNLTQEQADQHAKARAKEHARHAFEVIAHVVGDPSIDPGGSVTLSGTPFDGTYQIDTIHHELGMGGYTMTIHAKSPSTEGGGPIQSWQPSETGGGGGGGGGATGSGASGFAF